MVEYYVEKARAVLQSQRFSEVMTTLKTGFKGGYRFGEPKTPFGHILQQLKVKLKPVNRKAKFDTLLKHLKGESDKDQQSVRDIIQKLMNRVDYLFPILSDMAETDETQLTSRLQARKAKLQAAS